MSSRTLGRLALTITFAVGALLVAFPAAALAADTFVGGPTIYPAYIANDHTPIAVHYAADATLTPNTQYWVKVRFTRTTVPNGGTNRGYTWNPVTHVWVQERNNKPDWSAFPKVTTDASGYIPDSAGWLFAKFGDDTVSGTYHLMISLNSVGSDSTQNSSVAPTVTVFDPRLDGCWVHNGAGTAASATALVRVTDEASTTLLSMTRTEAQGVDDDADGVVDNEDYGPAGPTGDFRVGLPVTTAINVSIARLFWAPANGFVTGPADTDLAIGASDLVAPTAPGAPEVTSGDTTASISWAPATDDTGVAGYYVYRWQLVTVPGAAWSNPHIRVATLPADATSFSDSGLTDGTTYYYEVRAFDLATNVGPRSATATATPIAAVPVASVDPIDPDGSAGWYIHAPTVTLTPSSPQLTVEYSLASFGAIASNWKIYSVPIPVSDGDWALSFRQTDGSTTSATQQLHIRVDIKAPTASFVGLASYWVPAGTASASHFPVTWKGTDVGASGVDTSSFDVQYRDGSTGATTPLSFTSPTSATFNGVKGHTYYFQVRARDNADNQGAWSAWSAGTVVPYDQTTAKYSSHWSTVKHTSAYLGSVKYTTHNGAYTNFTLSKGTLYLVATTGPKNGKVKVSYRGKVVATISTYSRTTHYRQLFKIATYTKGAKPSSVKLVAETKHSRPHVDIDGFALRW